MQIRRVVPAVLIAAVVAWGSAATTAAPQSAPKSAAQSAPAPNPGSRIQRDADVAVDQPAPHNGTGMTTAYPFFADLKDLRMIFRKRALHAGASIGAHTQEDDEIYYVISGTGAYTLDGKTTSVSAGTALLTRPGSTHSLKQTGKDDLVVLITYLNK
jgi:mannose-6-phosphate isomerase-like protein (cupin superfamily)